MNGPEEIVGFVLRSRKNNILDCVTIVQSWKMKYVENKHILVKTCFLILIVYFYQIILICLGYDGFNKFIERYIILASEETCIEWAQLCLLYPHVQGKNVCRENEFIIAEKSTVFQAWNKQKDTS